MPARKDRVGETSIATNGQKITIIAYRGSGDIDVRFEDGYVAYNKHYNSFKAGTIKNPNTPNVQLKTDIRTGETVVATNGQAMTIIAYRGSRDIDVRFEDGYVACHKQYDSFKRGTIRNPNKPSQLMADSHIGETAVAANGQVMTIIAYRGNNDIDVRFEDGYVAYNKQYSCFKRSEIKNPNKSAQLKTDIRIGETTVANNGQKMTIIAYRGAKDIDVQFEDGYVAYNKGYQSFKKGKIKNPNFRIGETSVASNGQVMTIIAYRRAGDIDIQFEDGYVACNKSYQSFKKGEIKNPNKSAQLKTDIRIGETTVATNGQRMTIIAYRDSGNIDVRFEDGYVACHKQYDSFKEGKIRNPNTPNVQLKTNIRIGETTVAKNGQRMTIIAYRGSNDIDVRFEDGYVACHKQYLSFKKGGIVNPRFPIRGKGTYKTFQTQYAYTTPDGSVYFYCECQKCGWKKNLTAHEIINLNHACEDTEGSETQCPQKKTT